MGPPAGQFDRDGGTQRAAVDEHLLRRHTLYSRQPKIGGVRCRVAAGLARPSGTPPIAGIVENEHRSIDFSLPRRDFRQAKRTTQITGSTLAKEDRAGRSLTRKPAGVNPCAFGCRELDVSHDKRGGRVSPPLLGRERMKHQAIFPRQQHGNDDPVAGREADGNAGRDSPRQESTADGRSERHQAIPLVFPAPYGRGSGIGQGEQVCFLRPSSNSAAGWDDRPYNATNAISALPPKTSHLEETP